MIESDPYNASGKDVYECWDCLKRVESKTATTACPECGGAVQNLAVPRE
jgi:Zn finger protein HypA/HybF involved in hydrogenase expression